MKISHFISKALSIHTVGNLPLKIQHKIFKLMLYFTEHKLSKYVIPLYCRVNYENPEYVLQFKPSVGENYNSFQDFFTRRYKLQPRPSGKYMWPCEGLLCESGIIGEMKETKVKKQKLKVVAIFGNIAEEIPDNYYYSNIFLHNRDYHYIHAPIKGFVSRIEYVRGGLIMLRPWFYPEAPSYPALRNERVNIDILTVEGNKWYLSIVGGLGVGTIVLSNDIDVKSQVKVGEEIAKFMIGSTCCIASPIKPSKNVGDNVLISEEY